MADTGISCKHSNEVILQPLCPTNITNQSGAVGVAEEQLTCKITNGHGCSRKQTRGMAYERP